MAKNLDFSPSNLLCLENTSSFFEGDLDFDAMNEFGVSPVLNQHFQDQIFNHNDPFVINNRSSPLMGCPVFALQSDDVIKEMVEKEIEYLPRNDYLMRLRNGDLELSARRDAIDWICKACAYFNFGHLTRCLSISYFDRFLSMHDLDGDKTWIVQLLAVACLSIAAKIEETMVPLSINLQIGEPKFVFEAETIQRMELLVLSTLKWKMQGLTPCSFIDYFLSKLCNNDQQYPSSTSISRSLQLIMNTIKGIDLLEFRPSEIAAAVAISVSREMQSFVIDEAIASFIFVKKERVLKCVEVMKDLSVSNGSATPSASSYVPHNRIGVSDGATCLSYKSDEIRHGLFANCYHYRPDIKRRKLDKSSPQLDIRPF